MKIVYARYNDLFTFCLRMLIRQIVHHMTTLIKQVYALWITFIIYSI